MVVYGISNKYSGREKENDSGVEEIQNSKVEAKVRFLVIYGRKF